MSKIAEHTAGPWAYRRTHQLSGSYWYVVVDAHGRGPIVDVGGHDLSGQIAEAKHLITDERQIEANARLIASAPDLLKALEETTEAIELFLANHAGLQTSVACNSARVSANRAYEVLKRAKGPSDSLKARAASAEVGR